MGQWDLPPHATGTTNCVGQSWEEPVLPSTLQENSEAQAWSQGHIPRAGASKLSGIQQRRGLAVPGGPLQPATAHKLQGGGWWPTGFKTGPASLQHKEALYVVQRLIIWHPSHTGKGK